MGLTPPVALVNMPFSALHWPSMGLGLLKAGLKRRNIDARVYNFNLRLARQIGTESYQRLAFSQPIDLAAEWVFSIGLYPTDAELDQRYVTEILEDKRRLLSVDLGLRTGSLQEAALECRKHVEPFLSDTLDSISWERHSIVGFTSVFQQQMASLSLARQLFYETKSNLRKEQIKLYREAGLTQIQPGIESLVTPVLRLMRKGVSRLQNIQTLKWCHQFGVRVHWNYIIGFPGEDSADYEDQAALIRAISHLAPPDGWGEVRFDRFSPYFTQSASLGVRNLSPFPSYHHVYRGLDEGARFDLAYYFEGEFDGQEYVPEYTRELTGALDDWMTNEHRYALCSLALGERVLVFDLRPGGSSLVTALSGADRAVLEACDSVCKRETLHSRVLQTNGRPMNEAEIAASLARLVAHRFVIHEGEDYLSVVVPLGFHYALSGLAREQFLKGLHSLEPRAS